jgi:hypothetical protein
MVQRCNTPTHKQSKDYHGRGIKVLFVDRFDFITWALAKWPDADFKEWDFGRVDNDGHYSKDNLVLEKRGRNHLNRRDSGSTRRVLVDKFMEAHPDISYARVTLRNLMEQGLTDQQILERHAKAPPPGKRRPKSENPIWKPTSTYMTSSMQDRGADLPPTDSSSPTVTEPPRLP